MPRSYYNNNRRGAGRRGRAVVANWNDDYGRGNAGNGRSGGVGGGEDETESEEEKVKWYCGRWKAVRVWKLGRGAKRKEARTLVM